MEMALTMKKLYAKAMAMAPPASAALARKRSWTEMSHIHIQPEAIPTHEYTATGAIMAKKNKCALSACTPVLDCCMGCNDTRADKCAACAAPPSTLTDEAQRFLNENPFDDLPHPVLKRQQAVSYPEDCYLVRSESSSDDNDDMMGQDLRMGMPPLRKPAMRWNTSVVGASLNHIGRQKSGTLQQRRM